MNLIFLLLSFITGFLLSDRIKKNSNVLELTSMGIGVGYIISGWVTYIVSYVAKVLLKLDNPKMYGNAVTMVGMGVTIAILLYRNGIPKIKRISKKEFILFGLLFISILGSMFYVFYVKDNTLYSGGTVYSDYSPHTAMIRSFSYHDNFPTQYPHYGGEDVKYHFMFQFLVGNLEYLGMRIDWAFNITSAAALWGFLVLFYYFAKKIAGTKAAAISVLMFFCRSSFAALEKLFVAFQSGDFNSFLQNATFIGYTEHEDWGLWNYNVFLNQRHLGIGLLIAMIVISYFVQYLDWIDIWRKNWIEKKTAFRKIKEMRLDDETILSDEKYMPPVEGEQPEETIIAPSTTKKSPGFLKTAFFIKDAWVGKNSNMPIVMGILLGSLAFWNGAVVVAAMLILFGFAIFSSNKLDFVTTAIITICLSVLQTKFFTVSGVGINYQFGFLAEPATLYGIAKYLLLLSGIFFVGICIFLLYFKGKLRAMLFAFLLPILFAFTISMTPDIAVNHKYIMISVIFLNIFWGYALDKLFEKGFLGKAFALILLIALTITGAYDLLTIYNADKSTVSIDMKSELTDWLRKNVSVEDLVLVYYDAMSDVSMAGTMMYDAWPYYAWSAGYDTDSRDALANTIFSETDPDKLRDEIKESGVDYIAVEDGNIDATTISKVCKCIFDYNGNQIYKVPDIS